jgi:hypothetical protein
MCFQYFFLSSLFTNYREERGEREQTNNKKNLRGTSKL